LVPVLPSRLEYYDPSTGVEVLNALTSGSPIASTP